MRISTHIDRNEPISNPACSVKIRQASAITSPGGNGRISPSPLVDRNPIRLVRKTSPQDWHRIEEIGTGAAHFGHGFVVSGDVEPGRVTLISGDELLTELAPFKARPSFDGTSMS